MVELEPRVNGAGATGQPANEFPIELARRTATLRRLLTEGGAE